MVKPKTPYNHLFRLLHWVLGLGLPFMVISGLSLHATAQPDWSFFSGRALAWMLEGRVGVYHLLGAVIFMPAMLIALGMHVRKYCRRSAPWNPRRISILILFIGGLLMISSALALLFTEIPAGLHAPARLVHAVCGLVMLPVGFLIHAAQSFTTYRRLLVKAFHPLIEPRWLMSLGIFVPSLLVCSFFIFNGLPFTPGNRILHATHITSPADDLQSLPWNNAKELDISLINGCGLDNGHTIVRLQAFHDGRELFMRATWDDPVEDRRYWPWKKNGHGWERLVTNPDDEQVYYEDKFSLIYPVEKNTAFAKIGCAIYCHVDSEKPYGYKASGHVVDVWHWKASRSDSIGIVDDKHWFGFDKSQKDVGRHGDPFDAGGMEKNYERGVDHPPFLPVNDIAVFKGALLKKHATAFTKELSDTFPPRTTVPGIVVETILGDRGDVHCQSEHRNGQWVLYIRRALQTRSDGKDVQFKPGGSYDFACAAFDHAMKRHAYNHQVYRLVLDD